MPYAEADNLVRHPSDSMVVKIAAAALSGHRAVVPTAGGSVEYADKTNSAHAHLRPGITTGAALTGAPVTVVMRGEITEPTWSWTPLAPIYLGLTGLLTQTAPTAPGAAFLLEVGVALSATSILVDPQFPISLI